METQPLMRREISSETERQSAKKWGNIILASLGVGVGLASFFAGLHLKNVHFGAWGLVSGSFAALTLHLAILHKTGMWETWYTPKILCVIITIGIIGSIAGLIGAIIYIIIAIVNHKGTSFSTNFYINAAETLFTFLWGLYLGILACFLKRKMERQCSCLS